MAAVVAIGVLVLAPTGRTAWGALDIEALEPAVVWIQASQNSKAGAGVVVKVEAGRAYVLTAYHVVKDAWEAQPRRWEVDVRFRGQTGTPARGRINRDWLLSGDDDLALLVVEGAASVAVIPLGSLAGLKKLDEVVAIGHPAESSWAATRGQVSNFEGRHVLFSGNAVDTGNSGGPLLDSEGRMVGLVVQERGNLGRAARADYVRLMVEPWIGALPPPGQVVTASGRPEPPAPAPTPRPAQPPSVIAGKDGAEMVLVPAGQFWMGSDEHNDEKPRHRVTLDSFYIDKYEMTNALYQKFMSATGRPAPAMWNDSQFNGRQQPVVGVSWNDADAYCRWAGKRLPTEAEWEKAARGTDGRKYPWGDQWDASRANSAESSLGKTVEVGSYPTGVSPSGAHDMAGNAWEWVADWYDKDYYKRSPERNPRGPDAGTSLVLRGGSWINLPISLRTADRVNDTPGIRDSYIGFRCARGLSP